jgi:hypothetical protein
MLKQTDVTDLQTYPSTQKQTLPLVNNTALTKGLAKVCDRTNWRTR